MKDMVFLHSEVFSTDNVLMFSSYHSFSFFFFFQFSDFLSPFCHGGEGLRGGAIRTCFTYNLHREERHN